MWRRNVMRICSCTTTHEFTINLSTSRLRMLECFKHDHARCFTHHESIPVLVVGTARCSRVIISLAHRLHRIESAHTCFADHSLASSREDDVSLTESKKIIRFYHCIGAARTCAHHCEVRTAQVVTHADLSRSNVEYHFRYEEGIETGSAIALCEIGYLMLESDESSDTAREHHTDPVGIGVVLVKSRVGHRLIAGNKCKLREAIYLSCFLPVEMLN